jgi:hypothetical protein
LAGSPLSGQFGSGVALRDWFERIEKPASAGFFFSCAQHGCDLMSSRSATFEASASRRGSVILPTSGFMFPARRAQWPALDALIGAPLNQKLIEQQFPEILHLAASIGARNRDGFAILRKLGRLSRLRATELRPNRPDHRLKL